MVFPCRALALFFLLGTASACLSSTHQIPKNDLMMLTEVEPARRGEKVRVIQAFSSSDNPPKATYCERDGSLGSGVHFDLRMRGRGSRAFRGSTGRGGGRAPRGGGSKVPKKSGKIIKTGRGGSGGGSLSGIDGDAAAVLAVVVVASAAAIALVAASSEGRRYDGWAKLAPTHPVHLVGAKGSHREVPLGQLTLDDARWANKAYVRKSEGTWRKLGRAPLNRKGWAYSVFVGAGELGDAGGSPKLGTSSHIQLGYFLSRDLGLHGDLGFAWGSANDPEDSSVRFLASAALEAQFLPLQSGRIHAGAFGQAGSSVRTRSAGGGSSSLFSAGPLMQLDITTRLALTARAGLSYAYGETASELGLGLSIY